MAYEKQSNLKCHKMRRTQGQPLTNRSAKARAAVARAAHDLFLRWGFAATSMDAIADQAGVSKATLYAHFSSKDHLFCAVVEEILRHSQITLTNILENRSVDERSSAGRVLRELGSLMLHHLIDSSFVSMSRIVISEIGRFPKLGRALHDTVNDGIIHIFSRLISRLAEKKLLAATDPDLAARQLVWLLKADFYIQRLLVPDAPVNGDEIDRNVDIAVSFFMQRYGM